MINLLKKTVFLYVILAIAFVIVEVGYRVIDPFPYFSPLEINDTEHGNLSHYDPLLGWRGVSGGQEVFTTKNSRTLLWHNKDGHRDIEHISDNLNTDAVVFLGDSFTWGYEVEEDQMFVSLLRKRLKAYEVFNLGHRGYGTDQSLLTFRQWQRQGPTKLVILCFYNNDVEDNNSSVRYDKAKPKFEVRDGQLTLTNVPVPRINQWDQPSAPPPYRKLFKIRDTLLQSHFLHDIYWRWNDYQMRRRLSANPSAVVGASNDPANRELFDFKLTARLLRELRDEVEKRGAKLVVVYIPVTPTYKDFAAPCENDLATTCKGLNVGYLDLTPALDRAFFRVFFKGDIHFTPYGHRKAAEAIYAYLMEQGLI